MARHLEPVKKKPAEVLADVRAGVREAAIGGAAAALRYLERTVISQHSLPNGVKFFAWDLFAEYCYQTNDFERCAAAVQSALKHWPDAEEAFALELKNSLSELHFIERGISVRTDAGDFAGALALCDFAVAKGLGRHYEAKRESLEWAR